MHFRSTSISSLGLTAILSCTMAVAAPAESGARTAPVKIGWSGPLSGDCAVVGVDAVPAIQMVFEAQNAQGGVNGRKLELVAEDDKYNTTQAVSAYKKLVFSDKVPVVMMSTYGAVFALDKETTRDNILLLDTLDCNEEIAALPGNTLCVATKTESISDSFVADILRRKFESVLILVEERDGWMQLIARNTARGLRAGGLKVFEDSTSATEYKENLLRARGRGVQAIVVLGNDYMGLALRQARDLGMAVQFYGIGSFLSPGFRALAGDTIENALVSSWEAPRTAEFLDFIEAFKKRTGHAPYLELAVIPAYDAAWLLVRCLPQALTENGAVSVSALKSCLLQTRNHAGLSGSISFDQDGAVRSIHERLYRIRGGKLVEP